MAHPEFNVPQDAIEVFKYLDYDVYIVQNPYQYSPWNEVTYRAFAINSDGKTLKVGGPDLLISFTSTKTLVREVWKRIDALPPKALTDVPVPDYEGFKISVSRVAQGEQAPPLYHGYADRKGLHLELRSSEAQVVINTLRLRIDRYVAFGFNGDPEESPED